jgi:hypothetical protein
MSKRLKIRRATKATALGRKVGTREYVLPLDPYHGGGLVVSFWCDGPLTYLWVGSDMGPCLGTYAGRASLLKFARALAKELEKKR